MSRLGSGRASSASRRAEDDMPESPALRCDEGRSGSVMDVCTSLTFFLNSRMPFPKEALISGMRLAPNSTRTMTRMIVSSPIPKLPNIESPSLEERPGDQVRNEYAQQAQKADVEHNGTE